MEGLSRDEAFFLNEEIGRMDDTVFDCMADEDEPVGQVTADEADFDEL